MQKKTEEFRMSWLFGQLDGSWMKAYQVGCVRSAEEVRKRYLILLVRRRETGRELVPLTAWNCADCFAVSHQMLP